MQWLSHRTSSDRSDLCPNTPHSTRKAWSSTGSQPCYDHYELMNYLTRTYPSRYQPPDFCVFYLSTNRHLVLRQSPYLKLSYDFQCYLPYARRSGAVSSLIPERQYWYTRYALHILYVCRCWDYLLYQHTMYGLLVGYFPVTLCWLVFSGRMANMWSLNYHREYHVLLACQ